LRRIRRFRAGLQSGDHAIVTGRVHRVKFYAGEPLVFHRSRFGTVVADTATG